MPPKKRKSSAPKPTPPAKTSKRSTRHASTIASSQTIADPSMSIQPVSQINTDLNPTTQPVSSASNPLIDYDQLAADILRQQQQAMPSTSNPPIADTQLQASSSSNSSIDLNNANLLNNLQQLFSGESVADIGSNTYSPHPVPFTVADGIPLGSTVPVRVKNKIWNDQFIDLKCLLPNFKQEDLSIKIENNSIQFNSQPFKQSIMSLHQWTSAFLIFMSIYTEKLPQESVNLLKYCFTVREIGSSNGDNAWRYYDENFRKLRQSHKVPWQVPITEYMVKASTLTHSSRPSSYTQYSAISPRLFCFSYNNGKKCKNSPCNFKHMCQLCNGQHPKINCNRDKSDRNKANSKIFSSNNNKA